jgi:DNA uptake protein ComE-like DNA-binding protein
MLAALALSHAASAQDLLDANQASEADIAAASSAEVAAAIVAARPFETIGDLNELLSASMTAAEIEALYARLFVPINLNSASEEDILLIPGVGKKMAHEFEEYRPYGSMEQFRREIGKYVDENEVARLEMYVTLD